MRQRVGGVPEPWWRPMLRCPCFWGGDDTGWSFPWYRLCVLRLFKANTAYREWRDGPWWPNDDIDDIEDDAAHNAAVERMLDEVDDDGAV